MVSKHKLGSLCMVLILLAFQSAITLQAQSTATLQETYQWIASKMAGSVLWVEGSGISITLRDPEMNWNGCDVEFTEYSVRLNRTTRDQWLNAKSWRTANSVWLSLGSLNTGSITTKDDLLKISTTQSKPAISYKKLDESSVYQNGAREVQSNDEGKGATLAIRSSVEVGRMKNALVHAVSLCGGAATKDTF